MKEKWITRIEAHVRILNMETRLTEYSNSLLEPLEIFRYAKHAKAEHVPNE